MRYVPVVFFFNDISWEQTKGNIHPPQSISWIKGVKTMGKGKAFTKEDKIKAYIKKEGDPYCFMNGEVKVTMCFNNNGKSIEDQLRQCFIVMRGI